MTVGEGKSDLPAVGSHEFRVVEAKALPQGAFFGCGAVPDGAGGLATDTSGASLYRREVAALSAEPQTPGAGALLTSCWHSGPQCGRGASRERGPRGGCPLSPRERVLPP